MQELAFIILKSIMHNKRAIRPQNEHTQLSITLLNSGTIETTILKFEKNRFFILITLYFSITF